VRTKPQLAIPATLYLFGFWTNKRLFSEKLAELHVREGRVGLHYADLAIVSGGEFRQG
jgi:hypothetical protein